MAGHLYFDPFHFGHIDMTKIDIWVNGRALPTADGIKTDPKNKLVTQAYASLFLGTGGFFENSSILSYEEYLNNTFLVMFDLTSDFNNGPTHIHPLNSGTISLNINLEKPTPESVSIIALLEFEVEMRCDSDRNYWIND